MGHAAQRDAVVLHAEVRDRAGAPAGCPHAAEVGDERVVGVEHELRGGRGGHGRRPAVGDRLELAVAVQLVAEQVGQQQGARAELRDDAVQPELVDLEQAGVAVDAVAAGGAEQHAGDPAGHVRSRPVVDQARRRSVRGSRRPSRPSSSCRSSPR